MSIDDVRDYRNELARFARAALLRISPFAEDRIRRAEQAAFVWDAAGEVLAAPVDDVPPLPRFEYPKRLLAEATLDALSRRLAFDWITRELVRREEQFHIWTLSVERAQWYARARLTAISGIPVSGDDRPDVRV